MRSTTRPPGVRREGGRATRTHPKEKTVEAELHEKVLGSLPMRPWMTPRVAPLESHPNDPGAAAGRS